jgi:hypothetical protein
VILTVVKCIYSHSFSSCVDQIISKFLNTALMKIQLLWDFVLCIFLYSYGGYRGMFVPSSSGSVNIILTYITLEVLDTT